MFPGGSSGLNLSKVIGGISKTLKIANQIIPLYEQAKPMVKGARNAFAKIKNGSSSSLLVPNKVSAPTTKKTVNQNNNSLVNNPAFFK